MLGDMSCNLAVRPLRAIADGRIRNFWDARVRPRRRCRPPTSGCGDSAARKRVDTSSATRGGADFSMLPRDLPARLAHDGYAGPGVEGATPGLTMRVLSESKVRRYAPGPDEVCISIRARCAAPLSLHPDWVEVLRIACDDTGPYASPPLNAQALTREDAAAILTFVRRHLGRRRLVVHCVAGVSRSRSVAAAVARVFGLPYRWTALNADVMSAMQAAADEAGT